MRAQFLITDDSKQLGSPLPIDHRRSKLRRGFARLRSRNRPRLAARFTRSLHSLAV